MKNLYSHGAVRYEDVGGKMIKILKNNLHIIILVILFVFFFLFNLPSAYAQCGDCFSACGCPVRCIENPTTFEFIGGYCSCSDPGCPCSTSDYCKTYYQCFFVKTEERQILNLPVIGTSSV